MCFNIYGVIVGGNGIYINMLRISKQITVLALAFTLTTCGPPAEEIARTMVAATAQTATDAPAQTATDVDVVETAVTISSDTVAKKRCAKRYSTAPRRQLSGSIS